MKNSIFVILLSLIWSTFLSAQTVTGNLSLLANQKVNLEGFAGLKTYPISSTIVDDKGNFKLTYAKADYGVGYLISEDEPPFFLILSGQDIEIEGDAMRFAESIKIKKGKENQWFEQYAHEYLEREQALNAWIYLEKIYSLDSSFSNQGTVKETIQNEKQRIKDEDAAFIAKLPKGSYVSWFLPIRKLVSSVSTVAQYRNEEIPATISAFRAMDFTDQRLYKSGLFKEAIERHFWLLENSGHSLESVFIEMQYSIDAMLGHLIKDQEKLNEVAGFLFDLLERHSLIQASEYLAIKVLNETSCTINSDLSNKLESYRAMKKGNTAPDMKFYGDILTARHSSEDVPRRLSDVKSQYTVVVFGASWCPACPAELLQIVQLYPIWRNFDIEVLFVSLDEHETSFKRFATIFPFISICDYKRWESPMVQEFYVFATPLIYLLNKEREILLRPHSVAQLSAWVDWYLIKVDK